MVEVVPTNTCNYLLEYIHFIHHFHKPFDKKFSNRAITGRETGVLVNGVCCKIEQHEISGRRYTRWCGVAGVICQ